MKAEDRAFHDDADADPIFAPIEAHRRAIAAHSEAVGTEDALGANLRDDQQRSVLTVWREEIVETDDPRWIAAVRARWATSNSMDDLAIDLLNTEPTTVAGIEALLRYFADQEEGLFPDNASDDDGSTEAFGAYLVRHAADALRKIARPWPVGSQVYRAAHGRRLSRRPAPLSLDSRWKSP